MKYPAKKILLIATRRIGDVLLVTPLLRSLRHAYPEAMIDVLVYADKGGILEGNPDYNQLITVAEHPHFKEYFILLRRLFRRYDLAISTLAGDRPILYALFAARQRFAIVPPPRWQDAWKRLITRDYTELDNLKTHTVVQNLRLADLLDIPRCYQVVVPTSSTATSVISGLLPFNWQRQDYAVLHLVPMWNYKRWTLTGWGQLAQALTAMGLRVILTGSNDSTEMEYLRQALTLMPAETLNLAGKLRFPEVAELISACKIYVGTDTAVTHLAAACGVPTVALYGPTNHLKWAPWPAEYASEATPFNGKGLQRMGNVVLVQDTRDCVPCHLEGCDRHLYSSSRCLEELEVERVLQAVMSLLVTNTL